MLVAINQIYLIKKSQSVISKCLTPTMQVTVIDPRVEFLTPGQGVQRLQLNSARSI